MKKVFVFLALVLCGCATMYPDANYFKEIVYNFKKNKLETTNVGAEMMAWRETSKSDLGVIATFSQSLTYTGKQGNTLKIFYREYSDNYARPAFTQELTYDITQDSVINFRENRIGVVEANNRYISFIVFESPLFARKSGEELEIYPISPANTDTSQDIFRPGSGSRKKH